VLELPRRLNGLEARPLFVMAARCMIAGNDRESCRVDDVSLGPRAIVGASATTSCEAVAVARGKNEMCEARDLATACLS
jgi:hypothetical protein